jgi:pimeloyl-ACP methyl ester carboxylesterase
VESATETVKLDDIEVSVVRVGTGGPLVICGGPQLGHRYMRRLDVLADERELIYYDARGSGMTPVGDSSELTFGRAVADLEGLRAGLGLERFSILGHSLGGHVAYLYASAHPARVDSLVLVDVGPPFAEDQASELGTAMTSSRTPEDDARLEEIQGSHAFGRREPKAVEDFILNIYAPFFRDRRSIETVDLGFTAITAANVLDYEERLVASLAQEDPLARLAMVGRPTLVVHGELDPIPVAFGRLLADSIPGAAFALLPGATHFPFVEDRDQFERTVRPFLSTPATV